MKKLKIRHEGIELGETDPFENCKLNRVEDAKRINKIIENSEGGFTLAINGEWGVGKTTFIKMWEADLKSKGYRTIYLNAWEHDISCEPLICILGEICNLLTENDDAKNKLISKAKFFFKKALPIVINGITSHFLGDELAQLTKDVVSVISSDTDENFLDKEISDYLSRTSRLKDLRDTLEITVTKISKDRPLIFIVDELDRCRPDFAVEILEKIKHFFSVQNIVFVLSIDKAQLGYSIQGHYGSDKINAQEYLRRFIDIEYSLDTPTVENFVDYLYDYYNFDSFIRSDDRLKISNFSGDKNNLLQMAHTLVKGKQLTLRKVDKMFAHMRLTLLTYAPNQYIFPGVFLLIVYLKLFDEDIYKKIKEKSYSLDELSDILDDLLKESTFIRNDITYEAYSWVTFLCLYNECFRNTNSYVNLLIDSDKKQLPITSKYIDKQKLFQTVHDYFDGNRWSNVKLNFIIRHVEMIPDM